MNLVYAPVLLYVIIIFQHILGMLPADDC